MMRRMGRAKRNPSNTREVKMMGFASLYPSYVLGRRIVEQARGGLDHEVVMAGRISGITELLHQHDRAPREVVGQERSGIAAVEHLALLRLPLSVVAAPVEADGIEPEMPVGERAD